MKRNKVTTILALALLFSLGYTPARAQDWKSVLTNVASGVGKAIAGNTASATSIIGTWKYSAPDCQFESDNLLAKAGGEVAAQKVESKMTEVCNKIGLQNATMSYTFNEDGTYTQTLNNRNMAGTYTFNDADKTITMKSRLGISYTAEVSVSGSTMSLLFNADKLFSLLKTTAGAISKKSTNTALSTLTSLSEQYDGLMLGFELKKQ